MQYADDIAFMTTNPTELEAIKTNHRLILKAHNLNINNTKTEQYTISCKSSPQWKQCKYLGSLIDTTQEIHNTKCKHSSLCRNSNLFSSTTNYLPIPKFAYSTHTAKPYSYTMLKHGPSHQLLPKP
jgi:hypothetical protein